MLQKDQNEYTEEVMSAKKLFDSLDPVDKTFIHLTLKPETLTEEATKTLKVMELLAPEEVDYILTLPGDDKPIEVDAPKELPFNQ